jgi:hypothetical protein
MTLLQVEELTSYWAQHPPLHLLVAAYIGFERRKHTSTPPAFTGQGREPSSDAGPMLAQLGPGFNTGDVHAGLPPVVLDFSELCRRGQAPG